MQTPTRTALEEKTAHGPSRLGDDGIGAEEYRDVRTDDGVTISYRTLGTGPANLLFMHGWGGAGSGHSWTEVLKYLDLTGRRAIITDLRGHGRSEQTATGFTVERFARDMFAVADDAQADELILIGFSMSSKWAQWMACTAPERVAGQVLLGAIPASQIPFPEEVKQYWLQVARSGDIGMFEEFLRPFVKEPLPPDTLDRYFYDVTHTSQLSLGATLDMCVRESFADRLHTTRAATLVVGGDHDPLLPPDAVRQAIAGIIPGARHISLDCGHEIPVERPREAASLIEAFLAGLRR